MLRNREGTTAKSWGVILLLVTLSGCKQPVANVPPPPIPSARIEKPAIVYFAAEPEIVSAGQSSSIRWSVKNASSLKIEPDLGTVPADDRRSIAPSQTTTYELTASNAAGTVQASVTVAVQRPPAPLPDARETETRIKIVNGQLKDVHFDYNGDQLSVSEFSLLRENANLLIDVLRLDTKVRVSLEGYCDARGSDEYNVALADRRANGVKTALADLGVPVVRLLTIGFGKEHPLCEDPTEECYARNRRVHFSVIRDEQETQTASAP